MHASFRRFGFALLSLAFTAALFAQRPALTIRMGLWEVTSTTDLGGQMPGMDMSKMTPEQQAMMAAAMKGMMGQPHVTKSCLTQEKFDKSDFMMEDEPGMTCTHTIIKNTAAALDMNVACTGTRNMTGDIHIEALSPTSVKATMKTSTTEAGRTMNVNAVMTGKWLDTACGSVK
jgi:Protein of unknown function (DUF3617)